MMPSKPPNHSKGTTDLTTNEEVRLEQGDIMTVGELAEFLWVHPSMQLHSADVYRLLRRGTVAAFKCGSGWGFRREAIDSLVRQSSRQLSGS
jgi:hypothetical protein